MKKFDRKRLSSVRLSTNAAGRKSSLYDRLGKRIDNARDYV